MPYRKPCTWRCVAFEPYIMWKEPYIMWKEPYIMWKEPCILYTKPYTSQCVAFGGHTQLRLRRYLLPYIMRKKPCVLYRKPYTSQCLAKRAMYSVWKEPCILYERPHTSQCVEATLCYRWAVVFCHTSCQKSHNFCIKSHISQCVLFRGHALATAQQVCFAIHYIVTIYQVR